MAFRIAPKQQGIIAQPIKSKPYLEWLHDLPCVVTGTSPVEAAHVSFARPRLGAFGRGKGQKVSDRWALPLCAAEHRIQHSMNEELYWRNLGINPHILALVLWGIFTERGDDKTELALIVLKEWERHR